MGKLKDSWEVANTHCLEDKNWGGNNCTPTLETTALGSAPRLHTLWEALSAAGGPPSTRDDRGKTARPFQSLGSHSLLPVGEEETLCCFPEVRWLKTNGSPRRSPVSAGTGYSKSFPAGCLCDTWGSCLLPWSRTVSKDGGYIVKGQSRHGFSTERRNTLVKRMRGLPSWLRLKLLQTTKGLIPLLNNCSNSFHLLFQTMMFWVTEITLFLLLKYYQIA